MQIEKAIELSIEYNLPILLVIDDMLVEKDGRSQKLPIGGKKEKQKVIDF